MRRIAIAILIALPLGGCDPICGTTLQVLPHGRAVDQHEQASADQAERTIAIVDAVANEWHFEPRQPGPDFPPKDPNLRRGYSLDYEVSPRSGAHRQIYLTVSEPQRDSGKLQVRLQEFVADSESPLKNRIRKDLMKRLTAAFGEQNVRASGCLADSVADER